MSERKPPLVIGIGLPHSGGRWLSAVFTQSGYNWQHNRGGKLAADIAYSKAVDAVPFQPWPNAVGFSGLFRDDKPHLPHLRVQDALPFLIEQFPDAYFIRTHRDPSDWLAARYWAEGGKHRAHAAVLEGVSEAELPALWLDEDRDYGEACGRIFAGSSRYLDLNIEVEGLDKLFEFLPSDFAFTDDVLNPISPVPAIDLIRVVEAVEQTPPIATAQDCDMSFVTQAVDFMIGTTGRKGNPKALSKIAVQWTSQDTVQLPNGTKADIARDDTGTFQMSASSGLGRALGTLHEAQAHGLRPPLYIDMMDARFIGTEGRRMPPRRTLAFNRRKGAKNLILWPLPAYQSLRPSGQPSGFPDDTRTFEDKIDQAVWFGNMTGRMSPVLTPEGRERRGVYPMRTEMLNLPPDPDHWTEIQDDLMCVPRYRMVKTLRDHPDFRVGFVLRSLWQKLENTPAFEGLTEDMQPLSWFHQYRYVISIAGNDMGSNFLNAAASNSLVFKEEDDWELIYSDAFKPWVHYVPLEEGAQDAVEKLNWARAHPEESSAMAQASREMFDRFANPNNRKAILRGIAERLNRSD